MSTSGKLQGVLEPMSNSNAVNVKIIRCLYLSSYPPSFSCPLSFYRSVTARLTRLSKPSCVAPSVGPAPHCFSSLSTSSRPACRLCRAAWSLGEPLYTHTHSHSIPSLHHMLSLLIWYVDWMHTLESQIHVQHVGPTLKLEPLSLSVDLRIPLSVQAEWGWWVCSWVWWGQRSCWDCGKEFHRLDHLTVSPSASHWKSYGCENLSFDSSVTHLLF